MNAKNLIIKIILIPSIIVGFLGILLGCATDQDNQPIVTENHRSKPIVTEDPFADRLQKIYDDLSERSISLDQAISLLSAILVEDPSNPLAQNNLIAITTPKENCSQVIASFSKHLPRAKGYMVSEKIRLFFAVGKKPSDGISTGPNYSVIKFVVAQPARKGFPMRELTEVLDFNKKACIEVYSKTGLVWEMETM